MRSNAKRANRPNPREDRNVDRNVHYLNVPTNIVEDRRKKIEIIPRNMAQEHYLDLLEDETNSIVFATGPAGCGKSFIATLYAIQQLRAGNIEKIIITRPLVANGENIGALPGDLMAKLAPWCVAILEIFKEYYPVSTVKRMLEDETIELASLGLMRGRTFKRTIVIGDEMQNACPQQVRMFLTRIGDDARLIVTGDIEQHDRGYEQNGLKDFTERLARKGKVKGIGFMQFDQKDIERHPVITEILDLYK